MSKAAIIGFGKSGQSAYKLLKREGVNVYVFDDNPLFTDNIHENNFFTGDASRQFYELSFDFVVVSPGIKRMHPLIVHALNNNVKVISEIELAYHFIGSPIIAVTGTNGKTTTVTLIERIMQQAGIDAVACGNYGIALSELVLSKHRFDYFIIEISSYQLEFLDTFKPFISVILNIGSDHLNWHGSINNYKKAKLKIFKNQKKSDYVIINDQINHKYVGEATFLQLSKANTNAACYIQNDRVLINYSNQFIIRNTKLVGLHNMENIGASALVCILCGVNEKTIMEVSKSMETLDNRIEYVGEIEGVKFYNDSKSTNIDSVVSALNVFKDKKVVLILGGKHKGESFSKIMDVLVKKTKGVVIYGEDRKIYLDDLKNMIPVPLPALNIWGALRAAFSISKYGDVILFSPGGSSYIPFKNYEERGEALKKEFFILKKEYENS